MFEVVLFQPEIPPNTGNAIRLCANTGSRLHLVAPLGFRMDDRELRRAGLDYHEYAEVRVHADWAALLEALAGKRLFAFSTRAQARYDQAAFQPGDVFVFGPETRGLPAPVLEGFVPAQRLRLPMVPGNRSLNLSNAVAVVVYEAWRQNGFEGAAGRG
jgi:tRNA (cytidine/uridine-2'-O-)-methyltransferase